MALIRDPINATADDLPIRTARGLSGVTRGQGRETEDLLPVSEWLKVKRYVRSLRAKVPLSDWLTMEAIANRMREYGRRWAEFTHKEFQIDVTGLTNSGQRGVTRRLLARGYIAKRPGDGGPNAYTIVLPGKKKARPQPRGTGGHASEFLEPREAAPPKKPAEHS